MNQPTRRNFLKLIGGGAAAVGLAQIVGCHDDSNSYPRKEFEFVNGEDIAYKMLLECRPDGPYVVDAQDGSVNKLHFREANYEMPMGAPGAIKLGEYFVMTNNAGTPFTHILRYTGHDAANRQLTFKDLGTGTREVVYAPTAYANIGAADLIVAGIDHLSYVDTLTGRLVVDFNGDDDHQGTEVPITDKNGVQTWENQLC
jgi:hypothetical protein